MNISTSQFTVRKAIASGLEIDATSKRTGEKRFQVHSIELELKTFPDGLQQFFARVYGVTYRDNKIRANAATTILGCGELYILDQIKPLLQAIGDKEIESAFWRHVSAEQQALRAC